MWFGLAGFSTLAWRSAGLPATTATGALTPLRATLAGASGCFSFFFAISRTSSRENAIDLAGPADLRSRILRLSSPADIGAFDAEEAGAAAGLAGAAFGRRRFGGGLGGRRCLGGGFLGGDFLARGHNR